MAITSETGRWDALFAGRTRGDVGEGIAFVLGFLGRPDLISFAGGFPDPLTFPRDRAAALLAEFHYSAPARVGLLHADPHPGNFRITEDGRLGVLDFGAVGDAADARGRRRIGTVVVRD